MEEAHRPVAPIWMLCALRTARDHSPRTMRASRSLMSANTCDDVGNSRLVAGFESQLSIVFHRAETQTPAFNALSIATLGG